MNAQEININRDFTAILESRLHNWSRTIQIVIGPRQVGKTTGVRHVFDNWQGPKHFATADTPLPPTAEWIIQQWNRARALQGEVLLVIDEIQKIDRWSEVVKSLFDEDRREGRLKVVLLGSASLDLSRGISDSLVGRYEVIKVPHWSLGECGKAFGWKLEEFLKFGGYPGAAPFAGDPIRWQEYIANGILDPVINRDIPALKDIRKPALFRQVFELALNYPAQEVSFQKLIGQLQDSGNATTVKHYLQVLSQCFLLQTLEKYSTRPLTTKTSSPKLIPLCPALINAVVDPSRIDQDPAWRGRVFEACIGAQLLKSRGKLFYWREGHAEVDFVLQRGDLLYAIEIKSNVRKPVGGLNAFSKKFGTSLTLSLNEDEGVKLLACENVDQYLDSRIG
jgi:predicted AAA+ superfamily ATPase